MFEPSRRRFLQTGLAFIACAPAIVRASSLMPVRAWQPLQPVWQPVPGAYFLRDPRILLTPEMIMEGLASGKFFAHQSEFTR